MFLTPELLNVTHLLFNMVLESTVLTSLTKLLHFDPLKTVLFFCVAENFDKKHKPEVLRGDLSAALTDK